MTTEAMKRGTEVHDYADRLARFDWRFRYSRGGGAHVERCRRELAELQELQKRIDPDADVWNWAAPEAWRVKP